MKQIESDDKGSIYRLLAAMRAKAKQDRAGSNSMEEYYGSGPMPGTGGDTGGGYRHGSDTTIGTYQTQGNPFAARVADMALPILASAAFGPAGGTAAKFGGMGAKAATGKSFGQMLFGPGEGDFTVADYADMVGMDSTSQPGLDTVNGDMLNAMFLSDLAGIPLSTTYPAMTGENINTNGEQGDISEADIQAFMEGYSSYSGDNGDNGLGVEGYAGYDAAGYYDAGGGDYGGGDGGGDYGPGGFFGGGSDGGFM